MQRPELKKLPGHKSEPLSTTKSVECCFRLAMVPLLLFWVFGSRTARNSVPLVGVLLTLESFFFFFFVFLQVGVLVLPQVYSVKCVWN